MNRTFEDCTGCYCTECLAAIRPEDSMFFEYFGTCGTCVQTPRAGRRCFDCHEFIRDLSEPGKPYYACACGFSKDLHDWDKQQG